MTPHHSTPVSTLNEAVKAPLTRSWADARVTFHRLGTPGPYRGLWAEWHPERLVWVCCVAGREMHPRTFVAPTQHGAMLSLRLMGWTVGYRARVKPGLWDGRPNVAIRHVRFGDQGDLFECYQLGGIEVREVAA